jgi:lipid-A-disaccharide synthase
MPDCSIFISAGEASGEHYGALLITALKKQLAALGREATYFGMGGQRMADAGLERIVRSEDVAVMGITEVVRHLPRIYREFRRLKLSIRQRRPSVAVLIDFPDIHFKLAEELHALGIPVIFFVSPQLWAWKKHRIKLVQKYVDRMLVIFPFEEQFYRDHGVRAEFVGHPLADLPLPTVSREDFAKQAAEIHQEQWKYVPPGAFTPEGTGGTLEKISYELDSNKDWIALLPGSRVGEIARNLRRMVQAAEILGDAYEFIIPLAPMLTERQIRHIQWQLGELHMGHNPPRITFVRDAAAALFHARASVVASGTATVEAALIGNPFVVVYCVSPLTYAIAKRVVTVPHVAMANLIAGKRMVPELIQNDFTAANIVQHLAPLLPDGPPRQSMMEELRRMRAQLATHPVATGEASGAIDRVADITLETLGVLSPLTESVQS